MVNMPKIWSENTQLLSSEIIFPAFSWPNRHISYRKRTKKYHRDKHIRRLHFFGSKPIRQRKKKVNTHGWPLGNAWVQNRMSTFSSSLSFKLGSNRYPSLLKFTFLASSWFLWSELGTNWYIIFFSNTVPSGRLVPQKCSRYPKSVSWLLIFFFLGNQKTSNSSLYAWILS